VNRTQTYDFDGDLRLEEVDVLGEVERVLATVANHVRVKDVVSAFEDADKVCQVDGALKRELQQAN